MVVTKSNIYSESYTQLKSLIDSNITDPITNSTSSTRKWIYTFVPDVKSYGFKGLPFIVINPPSTEFNERTFNTEREDNLSFEIEVYSLFKDMSSFEDISNELFSLFSTTANIDTMIGVNMDDLTIEDGGAEDMGDFNNQRVIVRSFTVSFKVNVSE